MKTEAVKQMLTEAERIQKECGSRYLTGECLYLSILALLAREKSEPEKYQDAEYQTLITQMEQKGPALVSEDTVRAYIRIKEDAKKQKWQDAFQIWLCMGDVDLPSLWTYLQNDPSMRYLYDKEVAAQVEEKVRTSDGQEATPAETSGDQEKPETKASADRAEKDDRRDEDALTVSGHYADSGEMRQDDELFAELTGGFSLKTCVDQTVELREKLLEKVVGQNYVVRKFADGYFGGEMNAAIDPDRKGPKAIFLFAGSPGVGKTFLATEAAKILQIESKRFDMSGYANDGSAFALTGAGKNYVHPQPGALTGFVKEHPKCLLIFDEIEKAHEKVIHLFLQILDAGFLFDNKYEENVSFSDAIIIFTTNAGRQLYSDPAKFNFSDQPKKTILKALEKDINPATNRPFFPEAICSRMASGHVFMFNRLTAADLAEIAGRRMQTQQEQFFAQTGMRSEHSEELAATLLFSLGGDCDARSVNGAVKRFFSEEMLELFRLTRQLETPFVPEKVTWRLSLDKADPSVRELYEVPEGGQILFAGFETGRDMIKNSSSNILFADSVEEVQTMLQEEDVTFAVVDYLYKKEDTAEVLNAEDVLSTGRQMFDLLRKEYPDVPVLIGATENGQYNHEEELSFISRGADGLLQISGEPETLGKELLRLQTRLHQQKALESLALRHQVLSYETAQRVDNKNKAAEIILFDLHLSTAVEAEEKQAVVSAEERPNLHWEDVVVAKDIREELTFFGGYLQNPKAFLKKGARPPKGILMYGPPGTGKTSLAKVMATESDVTFLTASADQFMSRWAGEGPAAVHRIFATARKYAPAILFIDEIDAIGRRRTEEDTRDGKQEILNALLTEMDGFKSSKKKPVLVMAATNLGGNNGNTGALDPALVRRFDRSICVDLPDREGRVKLLHILCRKHPLLRISDTMIDSLAERSPGMSPALIEGAANAAIREAIRSNCEVTDEIMDEAFEKYNNGDEKHWDPSELLRTARHEAGHAFVSFYYGDMPTYLTIVARGDHGGYMQHSGSENKGSYSKEELLHRIAVSMAGRGAEFVYYGEKDGLTTGASGDLRNATRIARQMIEQFGMYGEIAAGTVETADAEMAAAVQKKINEILLEQQKNAVRILNDHKETVDRLVAVLMEKTHLQKDEIQEILKK